MSPFDLPRGAAYTVIVCAVALVWTAFTFFIRVFLRLKVNGPLGWDDVACGLATVGAARHRPSWRKVDVAQLFGIAQSCITLAAVRSGLGYAQASVPTARIRLFLLLVWVGDQLYIAATGCAMLSICLLVCRIARARKHLVVGYSIAGSIALWALVSLCFLIFECPMPRPWDFAPPGKCLNRLHIWAGSSAVNALLELGNVATAWHIVWHVQMPPRPKLCVLVAFTLRFLTLPPMPVRLKYMYYAVHAQDITLSRVNVSILSQITMHLSVILATLPCAKPLFLVFEAGVFKHPHGTQPTMPRPVDSVQDGHASRTPTYT